MELDTSNPFRVSTPEGEVKVTMIEQRRNVLPEKFMSLASKAAFKAVLRITGGCSEMNDEDKKGMMEYFVNETLGFSGVPFGGATRATAKKSETDPTLVLDPMVTDVPGAIAAQNPGAIALGTVPRTADFLKLVENSRLTMGDEYNTVPNPAMSAILIVQDGPDAILGWDGDLPIYIAIMENWADCLQFKCGIISWNGGGVTKTEIMESIKRNWPTFLVKGSKRVTDEIITKLENKDPEFMKNVPDDHNIVVVSKDNPGELRTALISHGFIENK